MVGSVTEVQSHDEGKSGKSVTGVHGSVTGIQNKSILIDGMEKRVHGHGRVTGAWLHCLLEYMTYICTVYSCGCLMRM